MLLRMSVSEACQLSEFGELSELSEKSRRQLAILTEALAVLESLGIKPWLTDGTLLGFWREHDFIAHDPDMDLGVLFREWSPAIVPAMAAAGFTLKSARDLDAARRPTGVSSSPSGPADGASPGRSRRDGGLEYTFLKNGERIDIFFFYERGATLWHAAWLRNTIQINYRYPRFGLVRARFLGLDVWVPEDPESYLLTKYGPKWREKDLSWSWAFSPKNRQVPLSHWPAFLWQYMRWRTKRLRYACKSMFGIRQ